MTDSVAVFPPGWRLLDASGDPVPGGVLRWYDAGTSTPKTVYSDHDLTTSLGTSVTVDAGGYPTSDGSTKVSVYLGSSDYKITAEDADAVSLWSLDDQKGAVVIPDAATPAAERPVETKSLDYTIVVGDQGKVFRSNVTGGTITYTLPSAVTAATGWAVTVVHAGTANVAKIATVSSQTITEGATSYAAQAVLSREGESMTLVSDGGNWVVAEHTGNPIVSGGVIPVEDRITAAPGSPVDGGYYLVTSSYSTFETHDILLYTGATYVEITPAEDCGWTAYVKDEDTYYTFEGTAWVSRETAVLAHVDANDYVQDVRLGTKVTEAVNLSNKTIGDVDGNVLVGLSSVTNNTENYYLRGIYRPLQISQNGSWTTVSVV